MWLLMVEEWLGTRAHWDGSSPVRDAKTELRSFATYLPLTEALPLLRAYQDAYNRYYLGMVIEFQLLMVQELPPDVIPSSLTALQVEWIDTNFVTAFEASRGPGTHTVLDAEDV